MILRVGDRVCTVYGVEVEITGVRDVNGLVRREVEIETEPVEVEEVAEDEA